MFNISTTKNDDFSSSLGLGDPPVILRSVLVKDFLDSSSGGVYLRSTVLFDINLERRFCFFSISSGGVLMLSGWSYTN